MRTDDEIEEEYKRIMKQVNKGYEEAKGVEGEYRAIHAIMKAKPEEREALVRKDLEYVANADFQHRERTGADVQNHIHAGFLYIYKWFLGIYR